MDLKKIFGFFYYSDKNIRYYISSNRNDEREGINFVGDEACSNQQLATRKARSKRRIKKVRIAWTNNFVANQFIATYNSQVAH